MTNNTHKILCSLDAFPEVRSPDITCQPYITQKWLTGLLEICHHLGVFCIFLKSLQIYGGDLNSFRTICFIFWNTKEKGKIAFLRNFEQWL